MENKKAIIGSTAPDFTIDDHDGKPFKLSDFKGKKVLLSFHPLAWTSVCAKQIKALDENKANFDKLKTVAVGISVDPVPSKKAWAKHLEIKHTRLLSDFWPHGDVAQKYGIFLEKDGISGRANIIIDEDQKISFVKIYQIWRLPNIKEIILVLEKMDIK
jgi:peroxiredoxin